MPRPRFAWIAGRCSRPGHSNRAEILSVGTATPDVTRPERWESRLWADGGFRCRRIAIRTHRRRLQHPAAEGTSPPGYAEPRRRPPRSPLPRSPLGRIRWPLRLQQSHSSHHDRQRVSSGTTDNPLLRPVHLAGIASALWLGSRRLHQRGGQSGHVLTSALWAIPAGIIGGWIYHVITDPELYFLPPEPVECIRHLQAPFIPVAPAMERGYRVD